MASTLSLKDPIGEPSDRFTRWARDIRLASGVVLLIFATTHFLNHALGIFGIGVMEAVQNWRYAVWHSWPGTVLLYGSFIVHPLLGLARVAHRRTFRMPLREVIQIALGLAIPILLINHIVGTRVMGSWFGLDESYPAVLRRLWPNLALWQSLLLIVVWVHGVIGINHTLRTYGWYDRWRDVGLALAVLIPVTALIGFVVAGREAALLTLPPEEYSAEFVAAFEQTTMWAKTGFYGVIAGVAAFVGLRELRFRAAGKINVRFVGHGVRSVVPGPTVLEVSRRFRIPIAAICGGRARCATCRVLVLQGEEHLPAPGANEEKLLRRISAPRQVRLACQLRPREDIQVQVLLPADVRSASAAQNLIAASLGGQTEVAVLVADLRAFSVLSTQQVPHELIGLLNRFLDEMSQAIGAHNGRIESFYGDGLMAVFGPHASARRTSRSAIAAAADMLRAIEALNREYRSALPLPIRIGIGVHIGPAVIGTVGSGSVQHRELTVGGTVSIACQLEAATRRLLADIIVSNEAVVASGRQFPGTVTHHLAVRGREQPMLVHAFTAIPPAEAEPPSEQAAQSDPVA